MKRFGLALAAMAAGSTFVVGVVSCGDDDGGGPSTPDASSDGTFLSDTPVVDLDAEPPPGDVCGDPGGLELNAPWPMRGGCPRRAGYVPRTGPQTGSVKWTLPIPAGESSPAVSAASVVWVGTAEGDVLAVSLGGDVRGALRTAGPVRSSPAMAANGACVVAGGGGILYGVRAMPPPDAGVDGGDAGDDAGDGGGATFPPATAAFSRTIGASSSSPAIGADGTIYIGTADGKLRALSADAASEKWSATTNDTLGAAPVIGEGGAIYLASSDGRLYGFAPDGATKMSFELGSSVVGAAAVGGDGAIYVGTSDGKLHAVETSGKERWVYATGGTITGTPAVYAGTVFVGSDDKKLHAVSTVDGKSKWTYATLGAVATPVIGADGTVYFGATDARLYAVRPSGLLFFAVNVKGAVRSAPALGDDQTLYVTTSTGVVAVGP